MTLTTVEMLLRVGSRGFDLAVSLARAIAGGDLSAVEQLAAELPEADQILARSEALRAQKAAEAEAHFARQDERAP